MAEKKAIAPAQEARPTDNEEILFFDASQYKAPVPGREEGHGVVRYPGTLRFLSLGAELFHQVCQKRGMIDKAQKVRIGWRKSTRQLVLVPAAADDKTAVKVTWSSRQRSVQIRLRAAFRFYGIEILKDSIWQVAGTEGMLKDGACMQIDLSQVVHEVEARKSAAAAQQEN